MKTKELLYATWAPSGTTWSSWVKPVLFSHATVGADEVALTATSALPSLPPLPPADGKTAIVIDLPAADTIAMTPALLSAGYRPIPLFNAVPGKRIESSAVNVEPLIHGLIVFGEYIRRASLPPSAPPAFLLAFDRRVVRAGLSLSPGVFDNRSISLPTDFPSAGMLQSHEINTVVLVQQNIAAPQPDLAHTLLRWQQDGITLMQSSLESTVPPIPLTVDRPIGFRHFWHRLRAISQFRRHPLGGFGGLLPMPASSG